MKFICPYEFESKTKKCVIKENPKSDLDLDLGFVNIKNKSC